MNEWWGWRRYGLARSRVTDDVLHSSKHYHQEHAWYTGTVMPATITRTHDADYAAYFVVGVRYHEVYHLQ